MISKALHTASIGSSPFHRWDITSLWIPSLCRLYAKPDETATEVEFAAVADQLAQELRQLDAVAFDEEESYWPVILEQTRDGLI